jgi:hypothetical protein
MESVTTNGLIDNARAAWREASASRRYRGIFVFSAIFFAASNFLLVRVLAFSELRDGGEFRDPFLTLFDPIDITWFTFTITYAATATIAAYLLLRPRRFVFGMQAYAWMAIFRVWAIYFLPLDPPETILLLDDPFTQAFGSGLIITKDLFFSGHTSTAFLYFLLTDRRDLRSYFLASGIVIGACVLLQHAHYTIDVIAAPFFSYAAYRLTVLYDREFFGIRENYERY